MKIVRIIYLVLVVVCMQTIVACQDDWENLNNGADVNTPVTVDLSFGVPRSTEIVLTRADNSESDIYGIRIYIFNGEKYLGMREINTLQEVSNNSEGRRYKASNVSLYQGTQTIYAVANITRTGYFQNATGLLTSLEKEAQKGKTEFLAKLYTLASATVEGGNLPQFTTQYMPLTGVGEITVNSATNVQGTVELKRMVAQVNFKINTEQTNSNGHKITFAPQSYIFYNVPEQGYMIEKENANTPATNYYNTKSVVIGGATGDENQAYFSVYVPENIQTAKQTCQGVYNNREAFKGTGKNKEWTCAPDNGMYVVLKGKYSETSGNSLVKYADVEYTVHLGDFSEDKDNYSVLRNNIYTYTVTVTGVENIIVEAKREELRQNSAEGDVVELTAASKMFNLDSHYEQVYVEYDLTEIANSIQMGEGTTDEDLKKRIALNFILSIHTPFNTREASDELVTPYNSALTEEEGMNGIDYKWVEFFPQSSANSISPYPGQTSDKLLSAWEVCQKMGEAVFQLKKGKTPDSDIFTQYNGRWYARFTIFVDEYFYAKDLNGNVVAWESYTHTDPRTMLIASDMRTSVDLNSTYSVALTYITQTSMETFYNGAASDTYNAMGIETYNENGLLTGFGTPVTPNSRYTYKDPSMGRANTLVNICGSEDIDSKNLLWTKYIDWTKVGYTDDNTVSGNNINYNKVSAAYYACLSRNRDLNGDGRINDDEVRWYLPALNQYLRMGIGAKALSENARPYTGDKNDLSGDSYINEASLENGALYYMSNYDQNFYWAVEVGSYGSSGASKQAQIRCVRNLPRKPLVEEAVGNETTPPVGRDAWADALYYRLRQTDNGENYMFYFGSRLLPALYRNSDQPQYGSYIEHTEESEPAINLLPKAFVVSRSYMRKYSSNNDDRNTYAIDDVCSPDTDPCRNYSENDEWDGYWRTPNLNELMIMVTQKDALKLKSYNYGAESSLTLCSTRFSNQNVRKHFYFNGNFITTSNAAEAGMVRCVRDASQTEIDGSIIIDN